MPVMLPRILCVLMIVTLAGCSRTDMAYRNADWLLTRWAAGLLDPDSTQADAWQGVLERAMLTHQRQLLPDVVGLLELAETAAADGLDSSELGCLASALTKVYQAHAELAVLPATEVLSDVSLAQIEHLVVKLRERNQEYRDDYLDEDPKRRRQKRLERYVDRIQRWTGDLSATQQRLVERALITMPNLAEPWLVYREERQRGLLSLLRSYPDRAALRDYLADWWVHLEGRSTELVQDVQAVRLASLDLILRLDALLTAAQRETFVENVADLRREFEDIAGGEDAYRKRSRPGCPASPDLVSRHVLPVTGPGH